MVNKYTRKKKKIAQKSGFMQENQVGVLLASVDKSIGQLSRLALMISHIKSR